MVNRDEFIQNLINFERCIIQYSATSVAPATFCRNCVKLYVWNLQAYQKFASTPLNENSTRKCTDDYFGQDQFNLAWNKFQETKDFWRTAACTSKCTVFFRFGTYVRLNFCIIELLRLLCSELCSWKTSDCRKRNGNMQNRCAGDRNAGVRGSFQQMCFRKLRWYLQRMPRSIRKTRRPVRKIEIEPSRCLLWNCLCGKYRILIFCYLLPYKMKLFLNIDYVFTHKSSTARKTFGTIITTVVILKQQPVGPFFGSYLQ